jgi:serine/threonine protein kinase
MAEGRAPYHDLLPMQVIIKIVEADPPKLSSSMWTSEFKQILGQMLEKKPSNRPTCKQLLSEHSTNGFLSKAKSGAYI